MALYDVSLAGGEAEKIAFDNSISGMNANDVQGAIDELKGTIGYSKKNLIPYPYIDTTKETDSVKYTVNDGVISLSGTSVQGNAFTLVDKTQKIMTFKKGKYILSGCPNGGSDTTYVLVINGDVNGVATLIASDKGDGAEFELNEDVTINYIKIFIGSDINVDGLVFKPMIRYASIEDDTYEPYVEDLKTRLGNIHQINLNKTLTSTGTPWLELQAQINKFIPSVSRNYVGIIHSGGRYSYEGYVYKSSDKLYGSFLIQSYTALYWVSVNADNWSYKNYSNLVNDSTAF